VAPLPKAEGVTANGALSIDHSLDSPWTTCVVLGIGEDGEKASKALQAKNGLSSSLLFAKDFTTGSKLLTNNKKTAGKVSERSERLNKDA